MKIGEKLKELGILSENYYPKKTFLHNGMVVVACYERELKEDFYFYSEFEKTLFRIPAETVATELKKLYKDMDSNKYFIPRDLWADVLKDEEYVELPDTSFREITIRQYACIHLGVPNSGLDWLDILIKESKRVDIEPYRPPLNIGPK